MSALLSSRLLVEEGESAGNDGQSTGGEGLEASGTRASNGGGRAAGAGSRAGSAAGGAGARGGRGSGGGDGRVRTAARAASRARARAGAGAGATAGTVAGTRAGARGRAGLSGGSAGGRGGLGAGGGVEGGGAGEVEQRGGRQVLGDGELHGVVGVGVAKVVPEGGDLVEELAATDLLPVLLSVLGAGNGLVPSLAGDGPAGLGDPNGLAASGGDGGSVGLVEKGTSVVDGVALVVLVVGVLVNTDPVDGVEDGLVGRVSPDVPGVDVADGNLGQRGILEGGLEVVDEADEGLGVGTDTRLVLDTGDGVAVQVLGTDGGTDDEVGELGAVLGDGGLQGVDLLVNVVGAGGPDTEKDVGLSLDGSLESLNGVLGGVGLDVGVETDSVEVAGGTLEALGSLELGLEVGLELGGAVGLGGTGVEAKVVLSLDGGRQGSEGSERDGGLHFDWINVLRNG